MSRIRFGTSGWRGIFCDDFTLDNVRVVTQAIADYLRENRQHEEGVVVGYDARFMGRYFARETVRVLAAAGIKSFLCNRDTPTPAIAFEILRRKASAGINFTASHNPYDYNGLKFSSAWGGRALPEVTRDVERRANAMLGEICFKEMPMDQAYASGMVEDIDPRQAYFAALKRHIDFAAIASSGMTLGVNPLYGAGRGYLDNLLQEAGVRVATINTHLDPYFGGLPPEPAEAHMADFIELVKGDDNIRLGLATDGDADRYGVLDEDGSFVEPNCILPLLVDYLVRVKGQAGDVARSVATSHFVDAVARHHGMKVFETPVGFKFIGQYIGEERILIGGEESAGLSLRGHVPDKDGILACLLVAEMVAVTGRSLKQLLADLYGRVGEYHTRRDNLRLPPEGEDSLWARLQETPATFAEKKIAELITIDGVKLVLEDGSWVLFRKSGTEPVLRLYGEAGSISEVDTLMQEARRFVQA